MCGDSDTRQRDDKARAERESQPAEKSYFATDQSLTDAFNREVESREAQESFERDGGIEF